MTQTSSRTLTFQEIIRLLQAFWAEQGCAILQPYDMEMGAGTFHPASFLRAVGPQPWHCAFVQPCRRPSDGRYGENPNRGQHYYQFQVILKPSPDNIQELYLKSLQNLGVDLLMHDIRFVEDNWESPSLGAWGLGWEVWQDGMEISQFTYFQQVGGLPCQPVTGELTYGLERLAMYLQNVNNIFDLVWTVQHGRPLYYGDLFMRNEQEQSRYNFDIAPIDVLREQFTLHEKLAGTLLADNLPIPAYEQVLRASHIFNLLDARGAISVTERQRLLLRVRNNACAVAAAYAGIVPVEGK